MQVHRLTDTDRMLSFQIKRQKATLVPNSACAPPVDRQLSGWGDANKAERAENHKSEDEPHTT